MPFLKGTWMMRNTVAKRVGLKCTQRVTWGSQLRIIAAHNVRNWNPVSIGKNRKSHPQWKVTLFADGKTVSGWGRSKDYVIFRRRVRMVSFETFRIFEMILTVSLTRLDSKRTSKDNLVENLTMRLVKGLSSTTDSIGLVMRTITSGSTHPL